MDETEIRETAASSSAFAKVVVRWLKDRLAHPTTGDAITWTRSAQAGIGGPAAQDVYETSVDGWGVTLTQGGHVVPSGYIGRYGGSVSSSVATTTSIAITSPDGDLIGFHADAGGPVEALFASVSAGHERATSPSRDAFLHQIASELPGVSDSVDDAAAPAAPDATLNGGTEYQL